MNQRLNDMPMLEMEQTVLMVDDRQENLASLEAILDDGKCHLLKAGSGEEALGLLLEHSVSLVLLDVQMPLMNGYEVARLMRGNRKTRNIPIIFITAMERGESAALLGYQSGAIDYITKPVNSMILQSKVALFLELDRSQRQLQQTFLRLENTKAFYESILNAAGEGVIGIDKDGSIKFANPAALALLGSRADQLIGRLFDELWQPVAQSGGAAGVRDAQDIASTVVSERLLRRIDGGEFLASCCASTLAGTVEGKVIVFQDITEHRALENELRQQSVTDHLTGLLNRNGFKAALHAALERTRRSGLYAALMFIDLDHFKRINDNLGHEVGDRLLKSVSQRLRQQVRAYDVVSRIGGDEFTVVLGDLEHPQDCAAVARKILQALRQPFGVEDDMHVVVSASIGIASYPECGDDIITLMRAADVAMYQAKRDGRNLYAFYQPDMSGNDYRELKLEQSLRQAVEHSEFSLHYQPQIDLRSGKLVGLEGLMRWSTAGQAVEPSVFIPLLEDTGLMIRAGKWAFREGCRQRLAWRDLLPEDCTIALNLSARQFADRKLIDSITAALEEHQLPPSQLELELTESMLMTDTEAACRILSRLKDMGIRVSIDDFGTGYSSLTYLKQFPLDALKIDRQFVHHLTTSDKDAAIATSIIQLAHNLGLKVVAEGIEEASQAVMLAELGCDIAQGFFFSRPLPPDQVTHFTLPAPAWQ